MRKKLAARVLSVLLIAGMICSNFYVTNVFADEISEDTQFINDTVSGAEMADITEEAPSMDEEEDCCIECQLDDTVTDDLVLTTESSYSPSAAIAWAKNHMASNHPSKQSACPKGWLCAEFVSRCLQAGGLGNAIYPGCRNFFNNISKYGTAYKLAVQSDGTILSTGSNAGKVSVGDVIVTHCDKHDVYLHAVLVSGIDSKKRLLNYAHNSNNLNSLLYCSRYCSKNGGKEPYANITAYVIHFPQATEDNTKPTISNVKITNIDANGYTVSCVAKDNSGSISKVLFPSWTTANGQDDLASNWASSTAYKGTYSSAAGAYTFRVNRSAHNNEYGTYTTRIYAYDAAGNVGTYDCGIITVEKAYPEIVSVEVSNVTDTGFDYTVKYKGTTAGTCRVWQIYQYTTVDDEEMEIILTGRTLDISTTVREFSSHANISDTNTSIKLQVMIGYEDGNERTTADVFYQEYDTPYPKIEDIEYLDVSDKGYTIRFRVESVCGIAEARVAAHPVEKYYSIADWETNDKYLATVDGDYVTYRVNTSDYDNITGDYRNYIKITDKEGRQVERIHSTQKYLFVNTITDATYDESDVGEVLPDERDDVTVGAPTTYIGKSGVDGFVCRLYNLVLRREADAGGYANWTGGLVNHSMTGNGVASGFFLSDELSNRGLTDSQYVELLYVVMLNRDSDAAGRQNWVNLLESGVSREGVFAGFAGSTEFRQICGSYGIETGSFTCGQGRDKNYGVTQFVSRLYTKALGRAYDVDGLNDWCDRIVSGSWSVTDVSTTGFFNSEEFSNKNLNNTEYVKVLYRTFLGREYDQAGLDDWVSQLNSGRKTRTEVLKGFSYSTEFGNIMKQYGL